MNHYPLYLELDQQLETESSTWIGYLFTCQYLDRYLYIYHMSYLHAQRAMTATCWDELACCRGVNCALAVMTSFVSVCLRDFDHFAHEGRG